MCVNSLASKEKVYNMDYSKGNKKRRLQSMFLLIVFFFLTELEGESRDMENESATQHTTVK